MLVSSCQTALSGILLSSHLACIIAGGESRALDEKITNGEGSLHAFEKSEASLSRSATGLPNFVLEWKLFVFLHVLGFDKCTTLGKKLSIFDEFMWASELHNPAFRRRALCGCILLGQLIETATGGCRTALLVFY